MRDMEELQYSHVLKVEELSRRKLSEDQNTIMEHHPTFPVHKRYFHLIVTQVDCQAATISRQIFGIRGVFWETFVQIHERLLRHFSRRIQSFDFLRNGRHTCTHKYGATRYMW